MKQNKYEITQGRQRLLIIIALILGLLAGCTGYFGFVYTPAEDDFSNTGSTAADQTPAKRDAQLYDAKDSTPSIRPKSLLRLCMQVAFCIFLTASIADIFLLLMLRKNIWEHGERNPTKRNFNRPIRTISMPITRRKMEQSLQPIPGIFLGKVHDLGKRDYQQDSFGQSPVLNGSGILAVLADGMGGLSNGERVSQKIVMEALNFAAALQPDQIPSALPDMVEKVNRSVNQMLGPSGLYTSGSTLVSALIIEDALWWISVGDSRIYLYRDSRLHQLSRDHDQFQDWMPDILDGKRSLDEAMKDPEGRKLTSFIGMGELRYVDRSLSPIPLLPGDRILLMSDGIYGTVSDAEMTDILQNCANVQDAASQIAKKISAAALPYQDNYTLVILGYDPPSSTISNGT